MAVPPAFEMEMRATYLMSCCAILQKKSIIPCCMFATVPRKKKGGFLEICDSRSCVHELLALSPAPAPAIVTDVIGLLGHAVCFASSTLASFSLPSLIPSSKCE